MNKTRRVLSCMVIAAAATALGACGSSSSKSSHTGGTTSSAPSTSASASTSTSTAASAPATGADQVRPAVLTAYGNFVSAQTRMLTSNTLTKQDLDFVDGNAYFSIRTAVLQNQKSNIVYTGRPASAPTITALDTTAKQPTATVLDCYGGPGWTPVYVAGPDKGKSAEDPSVPLVKHPMTSSLADENGVWKVTDFKLDWSNSC